VLQAQQAGDKAVTAGLLNHPFARVDQDDGEVGGRGTRHHVAGVLNVPRGIRDDELPLGRGKIAVGDINRDALLALGTQPIGQQRQIHVGIATLPGSLLNRFKLVLKNCFGVVHQAPDQGAFAVVYTACSREPQQFHVII